MAIASKKTEAEFVDDLVNALTKYPDDLLALSTDNAFRNGIVGGIKIGKSAVGFNARESKNNEGKTALELILPQVINKAQLEIISQVAGEEIWWHKDKNGQTLLHTIAGNPLAKRDIFTFLISQGFTPLAPDNQGITPLQIAEKTQNTAALKVFATDNAESTLWSYKATAAKTSSTEKPSETSPLNKKKRSSL